MPNIVAIILARGGSKGIPNKNITNFCGKPLICWSIQQALKSKKISSVWVSSDNEKILNVSKKEGAKIIHRPKKISNDKSSSESGWIHAINEIEKTQKIDIVVGIQATSPIRNSEDFDKALKKFHRLKLDSMFSCSKLEDFLIWGKNGGKLSSLNYNFKNRKRRQDSEKQILENGSFYIFKPKNIKKSKNRLNGKMDIIEMEFWKSFEIDSIENLKFCETIMKNYLLKNNYE